MEAIDAHITAETYSVYQVTVLKRIMAKGVPWAPLIGVLVSLVPMTVSWVYSGSIGWGLVVAAYGASILLGIQWSSKHKLRDWSSQLGAAMYGDWKFGLEDDGLVITSEYFTKRFAYRAFSEVLVDQRQIILLIGPGAGFHIPIPEGRGEEYLQWAENLKRRLDPPAAVA